MNKKILWLRLFGLLCLFLRLLSSFFLFLPSFILFLPSFILLLFLFLLSLFQFALSLLSFTLSFPLILLSLFFLWRIHFVEDLKSYFEGLDLMAQFQESLMDFAFQMGLDSLFSIVYCLNGAANDTNLEL